MGIVLAMVTRDGDAAISVETRNTSFRKKKTSRNFVKDRPQGMAGVQFQL
jgi:hypothetical protein